jgi:hypothetical protein
MIFFLLSKHGDNDRGVGRLAAQLTITVLRDQFRIDPRRSDNHVKHKYESIEDSTSQRL